MYVPYYTCLYLILLPKFIIQAETFLNGDWLEQDDGIYLQY